MTYLKLLLAMIVMAFVPLHGYLGVTQDQPWQFVLAAVNISLAAFWLHNAINGD